MVNFLAMPEYKVSNPFDVSPLYNALDSNQRLGQQQRQFDAQNKLQQAQLGIQQERLGMEKQTHAAQQHQIMAQRVGGMAQMGLNEKDPARRQAILDRIISLHPDKTKLGPEYLSPDTAFPMLVREAEGFRSRESDAKLGLIGAQTTLAQAQAQKARREAELGPDTFGKTGAVFQGQDGKFYTIQFGSRGQRNILPVEAPGTGGGPGVPLAPAKGVQVVGDEVISSATGGTVRNVGPQLSGGARAKAEGKEIGELLTKIPAAQNAHAVMTAKDKVAFSIIDRTLPNVNGWTAGLLGSAAAKIPGTPAHDMANRLNTLKAQSGFSELQAMRDASPTGGALGQVSEMENKLLQQVWTSIEQSQSPEELRYNLGVLREVIAGRSDRMRANIERLQRLQGGAHAGAGAPTPQGGQDMPRPSSPEEAARLPRGTRFIAPDGSIRTVP